MPVTVCARVNPLSTIFRATVDMVVCVGRSSGMADVATHSNSSSNSGSVKRRLGIMCRIVLLPV